MKPQVTNKKRTRRCVFHIVSHFDMGGGERVAANIACSGNDGFEYHLVEVFRGNGRFARAFMQELRSEGVACHRSPVPMLFHFHYVCEKLAAMLFPLWFVFLFLRHRPDVVHCHTEMPEWAVFRFFHLFPGLTRHCRVVRTIHNTRLWTGMERTGRKVEAWLQSLGANVAISESVLDNYQRIYHACPPIIYNGVAEPAAVEPFPGLVAGKVNILFAGRFEEQKGIRHLVAVVKALADDARYFFHIVGAGTLESQVHALAQLPNVRILPPMPGLSARLGSLDYLFMPSEFEGLPLMAIEAGLAHLPVIANRAPGLYETLPPDWPLMVDGNSHEAYLAIFRDVLPQGDRQQWAAAAYTFAHGRFGIRQMQQQYEAIYSREEDA